MKAYIVTSGDYSDYKIHGVFLIKKDAENYIYNLHDEKSYYDSVEIEEWDIGEGIKKKRPYWEGAMDRDGSLKLIKEATNTEDEYINFQCHPLPEFTYISFSIDAKSKEHAIKIINEKRAGIVASGMWDNPNAFPNYVQLPGYINGSIKLK